MNDNIKAILTIGVIVIIVFLLNNYNTSKNNDSKYNVTLNNEKVSVCGHEIYITDYTYNDEILLDDLINEIEHICQN